MFEITITEITERTEGAAKGVQERIERLTPGHAPVVLTDEEFKRAAKNMANLAKA